MGVHGLWELLAPVGRRVSVETLAGKKLAIDASIWLVQFMKAMRDDKGEMVRNAHLIGFFRRICKLLFLRTKPVFVFDGATPALKRRTVIARRRQRENAQAKIRKTAEKLLLNHLKSMRLKELANDIENQRLTNDAKGKKVVSDHSEVSIKNKGNESDVLKKHDQEKLDEMLAASIAAEEDERLINMASTSKAIPSDDDDIDDGIEEMIFPDNLEVVDDALLNALPPDLLVKIRKRSGTRDRINHEKLDISKQNAQEKLDAMLAASIAAEEDSYVTNNATAPSAEALSDEEDGDGDDEMIVPEEMQGAVDRAVLDSLPLSMRLDLFAQMKERQMAENRQKYQKVKKAPEKFSELQIQSYLKSVALRREINQVQKAASGIGVDGVQTSRIASEANKKFIFSSSFTGDKEMLASSRADRNKDGENPKTTKHASSESRSELPSTSKSDKISELVASKSKSKSNFEDGVETFLDEQGRVRVSRVRAMGIRMTRDLQRNLELMKEIEKDQAPASNIESLFRSVVDKRENEKLAESRDDANCEMVQLDEKEEQGVGENEASLQISFEDDGENKSLDGDDEIFARLVTETSVKLSSPEKGTSVVEISDNDSDWEEGIVDCDPKDQRAEVKASNEDTNADSEVEWEDGISASEYGNPISKGSLEEDAELQEAIRRSLKEQKVHVAPNEIVKEQTEGETGNIHAFAPASENTSVGQNVSFSLTGQIRGGADRSSKLNCQGGACFSQIADSLEEQESDSVELLRVADELSQVVQGSQFDISKQGDNMPKSEIIPESTQHLESGEEHFTTEEHRDVSAENCQISASADLHVKGSPCPSDMSGKIVSVDKSQNGKLVDSSITVSSNNFDTEQNEPDKGNFTEAKTVEASNLEAIKSSLDEEMRKLDQEYMDLGNEQKKHERNAESVSSEMFTECQELLQMFGLPYIIAPMEAEAQCAHLELANLVDGVVTDDSDVLLFGAQNVYKNIFDDRKYVETYFMKDIEKEFGLSREKLIRMALLLGSDYTEGISGIGIVNAIEVLNAFPEDDGLEKFREWIESPDPSILGKSDKRAMKRGSGNQNHVEELKQHFMETHRNVSKNWHVPPNFPSEVVVSAYSAPQVDKSAEPFAWGKPDIFLLRKLCWERFGWNGQKADELLVPVLNEYNKHETQLRMEAFYSFNEKFAKIRSKRIKKAVKGITGGQPSEPKDESSKAATKNARKRRATSGESAENKAMPSGEEEILGQNESSSTVKSRTDQTKRRRGKGKSEVNDSEASKRARGGKTARGRGRGRRTRNGTDAAAGFDSGVADDTNSSDNDFLEIPAEMFDELQEVRRSGRSRKAVDYSMGDSDNGNSSKSKSSLHASENHWIDGEAVSVDREAGGFCADEGDLQQQPDDASEPDYLKAGGGFCMEDEENTGMDLDGAAYKHRSEELCAERGDKYDDGNELAASATQHNSDMEKPMGDGKDKNPCLVPAGALTAMPFLRRKRKKN